MRSLHLILGNKTKQSTLQTIWEVWFTASVVSFMLALFIVLIDAQALSIGVIILLAFHVIMSTLVGITTTEEEEEESDYREIPDEVETWN